MNALSRNLSPLHEGELVSLLDMIPYYAKGFLEIGEKIEFVRDYLAGIGNPPEEDEQEETKEIVSNNIKSLVLLCKALDLGVSADLLDRTRKKKFVPKTLESYELLIATIYSEIGAKKLFYMSDERIKYYHNCEPLGSEARAAFPTANEELRHAGKCYAIYEHTACVYHCMRALESGLRALATDVGVTWTVQQWQVVINEIEKAIKSLGNSLPCGQAKSERTQFLSEAAKEFAWFKDGWRNYAAHARISYDYERALKVWEHVCAFFEIISRHLKEQTSS